MNQELLTPLEATLDQLIREPWNRKNILNSAHFSEKDLQNIQETIFVVDALWICAHGAPELENDPVAKMLGLL